MGAPIVQMVNMLSPIASEAAEQLIDQTMILNNKTRAKLAEELKRQVCLKQARNLGLTPIETLDKIKLQLNEKIIQEIKARKFRHIDVAVMAQIYRSRVTAIMNRKLERVSLDLLVRILNLLGIDPELKV